MFDEEWLEEVHVNEWAVMNRAREYEENSFDAWKTLESLLLLKAISLLDVSTLFGDDTFTNVTALVNKAAEPLPERFVHRVLSKVVKLLREINSTQPEETDIHLVKVEFAKTKDKRYDVRVKDNSTFFQVDDQLKLSQEELLEVKQILRLLRLDGKEVDEKLDKFLGLKARTAANNKAETKRILHVAAICVYPQLISEVAKSLDVKGLHSVNEPMKIIQNGFNQIISKGDLERKAKKDASSENIKAKDIVTDKLLKLENGPTHSIPIAAVAAGFPCGLYDLKSKMKEVTYAINAGASEIDIVISRYLVIGHRWLELYNEISMLRKACGNAKMKTILAVGECGSLENVYKASVISMMAGSYCIKTSTGKEVVNATFPAGLVMCRAIRNFYMKTGKKVGFKPAGGIRTSEDAIKWLRMIIMELGVDWLPLCRIGASSVLKNIESRLKEIHS